MSQLRVFMIRLGGRGGRGKGTFFMSDPGLLLIGHLQRENAFFIGIKEPSRESGLLLYKEHLTPNGRPLLSLRKSVLSREVLSLLVRHGTVSSWYLIARRVLQYQITIY